MEGVTVSTELLYTQRKRFRAADNPYNIDFWEEVRKRWLVFGVLAAVALAVISPRVGAPGGPLHLEYLSYLPSSVIYFSAGRRVSRPRRPARALRLAAVAALHAHVAAPALCVCACTVFGAALHGPVISGALLSSVGSGCAWLSLALSRRGPAALVTAGCYGVSLVATPLSSLLLCGRTSIPPLSELLWTWLVALTPFLLGCALSDPLSDRPSTDRPSTDRPTVADRSTDRPLVVDCFTDRSTADHMSTDRPSATDRPSLAARLSAADRLSALALVYAECCARLSAAEGGLLAGDVLATLTVEVCWVCLSVCACGVYARWWGAGGARLIAVCAVPKALDQGWGAAAACGLPALARLPAVFAAPAQALLLAAHHSQQDDTDDWDQ